MTNTESPATEILGRLAELTLIVNDVVRVLGGDLAYEGESTWGTLSFGEVEPLATLVHWSGKTDAAKAIMLSWAEREENDIVLEYRHSLHDDWGIVIDNDGNVVRG